MGSKKVKHSMRKYEAPEMEIVEFKAEDILTTSGIIFDGDVDWFVIQKQRLCG